MAIEPNGPAPYAPAQTVTALLDGYRNRGFATPITSDVLVRAGVPESLVNRTLQALRLLDLIDEQGQPSEQFDALKQARGEDEYKARLSSWLTSVYADVLQYADPNSDGAQKIGEAFRGYTPAGQRMRMVTLMIGLFEYAGIIDTPPKNLVKVRDRSITRDQLVRRLPPRKAVREAGGGGGTPSADALPPSVAGLLRDLPKPGGSWTTARRDAWWSTFQVVLNYAYPVDDSTSSGVTEGVE